MTPHLRISANCRWFGLLCSKYDHHRNKTSFEVMWRRTYVCLPIVVERVYCAAIMTIIKKDLIQSYVTMYLRMSANCRWLGLRCTNYDHHKNKTSFEVLWCHTYVYLPIVVGWVYCATIMTIIKTKPHSRLCDTVPTYVCQLSLNRFIVQQFSPS